VSRGQHAADDHSFQRSAGGAMVRGVALIVAAVLVGILLLRSTDHTPAVTASTTSNHHAAATTTTTAGRSSGTTSTTTSSRQHDPAQVAVLVANGSGVKGAASRVGQTLAAANYQIKTPTNTKAAASGSVVYYTPGFDADAKAIARLLTPQPAVQAMPATLPVPDLAKANILVVVAADLAGH